MTSFSNELYHYGIKGMKWGVRRTPEQLGKPQRTKEQLKRDKKRDKALAAKKKADEKEKKAEKKEAAKKARFEKRQAKERYLSPKEKAEIIKSPTAVMRNRDKFTNEELKQALERFKLEADIAKITEDQRKRGKQMVTDIVDMTKKATEGYDIFVDIYNTFSESDRKLKKINDKDKDDDKDKKNESEKIKAESDKILEELKKLASSPSTNKDDKNKGKK